MGNKNKLEGRPLNDLHAGGDEMQLRAERRRCAEVRGGPMCNLADNAVGFRLIRFMAMEGLKGRQSEKRRESHQRGESHEPFHGS